MKEIFAVALVAISVLTSLVVEAIKKVIGEDKKYSPNVLAMIVSVVVSVLVIAGYLLYYSIPFTTQIAVVSVALIILSFLCATLGYDKVIQTLKQIKG